jgi:hypothetical protein
MFIPYYMFKNNPNASFTQEQDPVLFELLEPSREMELLHISDNEEIQKKMIEEAPAPKLIAGEVFLLLKSSKIIVLQKQKKNCLPQNFS